MLPHLLDSLVGPAGDETTAWRRSLQPGETLIAEGNDASSVFVLVEGHLKVTRSINGETAMLAIIEEPGSIVGEMVSMGGGKRSATVTAEEVSEVIGFSSERFQELLVSHPDFTTELVGLAMRRAEEGELTELLADHFGIVDDDLLMSTCGAVQWIRLSQGEVLLQEGDESDAAYFVIRGRLKATRHDPVADTVVELGESGRGDVVGEMGLLGSTPRTATVTAVRDSVLARLDESTFLGLVDRQPRLLIEVALNAAARSESPRWHSSSKAVVVVAATERVDTDQVVAAMQEELERYGIVGVLSPRRVDSLLDSEGAAQARRGEVGDVRLSRLIHEVELGADHLLLDLGPEPGPWSRRAHGMADRLLMFVTSDVTDREAQQLYALVGGDALPVPRTLVVCHPPGSPPPSGTARLLDRFNADDVIHVTGGSNDDLARAARIAVGRGTALVLGGGGGRGFAHIGVLRALGELDVPVDIVGGTSIGGIIGSVMADGWTPDQIVEWAQEHFHKAMDYTLPVVSLTKGDRTVRAARATFGDRRIEDLAHTYFCVSTNLSSARVHVHRRGSLAVAIRSTSAIPGVMPPVPFEGDLLVDGGVLNNLPMDVAREMAPHGQIVAVDVAPVRGPGAHGNYGLSVSGWQVLRAGMSSDRRRYPRMSAVLMRSMISASMRERDRQAKEGLADCYLDLDMRGISMFEFEDPAGVAQRGYEAAMPTLEAWAANL